MCSSDLGSGDNGTILITDLIGTAIGTVVSSQMSNVITSINSLTGTGSLTTLTTIYEVMLGVVNGDYPDPLNPPDGIEIPSGLPGAGTYADADAAILALIALAQAEITTIMSGNLVDTATLNTAFISIATQMSREANYQKLATLNVNELSADSQTSIQTLIYALQIGRAHV